MYSKLILGIVLGMVLIVSSISVSFGSFPGSPNFQLESGVAPEDVTCNDSRVLVFRANDNPACVSFHMGYKLMQRGWTALSPIHEQISSEIKQTSSLERTPPPILISNLLPNSSSFDLDIQSLAAENRSNDIQDPRIIPTYVPEYYELKLYIKYIATGPVLESTNTDAPLKSVFWYMPNDVDINSLKFEYEMFQHGATKIIVNKHNYSSSQVEQFIQSSLSTIPSSYREQIGNFDAVITAIDNQHHITLYTDNGYSLYIGSTHLPLSELNNIILSLNDQF